MLHPNQGFTYNKFEKPNDWPKIDKTFDYKIENGKLLSANEYIYLSGPVTYTTVGDVKIKDNLASNFSNVNYLKSTSVIDYDLNSADLEVYIVLNNAGYSNIGLRGVWLCELTNSPINISIANGLAPTLQVKTKKSGESTFTQRQSYDFTYATRRYGESHFKLTKIGNVITLKGSNDGVVWSNGITYTLENDEVILYNSSFTNSIFMLGVQWLNAPECNIDLNKTYIKINNNLWFYGKNYTTSNMVPVPSGLEYNGTTTPEIGWVYTDTNPVKGPADYEVVGSPTIVNGIASGFDTNSYVKTSINFKDTDINNNIEMLLKIKTGTTLGNACFYRFGNSGNALITGYNGTKLLLAVSSSLSSGYLNFDLEASTIYWIWIKRQNKIYSIDISTDGKNFTNLWTSSATTELFNNGSSAPINLFYKTASFPADISTCKLYLNYTYIKVNGQPWFGYSSKFQEFISAPQGTMIGKDDTHSLAVETYQDKGIVDYMVVGSPTITDGVVSNFGDSNYLQIPALPGAQDYFEPVNPFEMVLNVNTDTLTRAQYLYYGDFAFSITASKNLQLYYYDSTAIWATGTAILQDNTSYDIKLTYDGANIIVSYKTDNNAYTQDIVATGQITKLADTETFGNRPTFNDVYLQGSINLNHTYIKINGSYWFKPYPNSFPKLVGPESYTEVGSPSITNGIITYTSSSDYIQLNDKLTWDESSDLEVYCRFKTPSIFLSGNQAIISCGANNTPFLWLFANNIWFGASSPIAVGPVSPDTINVDTWYRIKVTGKNNSWTMILYADDETIINQKVHAPTLGSLRTFYLEIFRYYNTNRPVEAVDLNNTYIKVNGVLWFGKEDWEPSTYTDNSIYLLSGHSSDYSSYNELAFTPTINNSGTYSVEIDNQKVFTGMSQSTYLEWDKLALTTGYNITTPSSLKAHTIKISPENNSNNIIGYNCNYDYTIKDGKLIDANPNIYWQNLTGGGEGSDFGYIDAGFKPTNNTTFEFAYTQKQVQGREINTSPFMINNPTIEDVSYNSFGVNFQNRSFNYFGDEKTIGAGAYDVKSIYKSQLDNNKNYYIYKTEGGTTSLVYSATPVSNQTTFGNLYLGCWHYGYNSGASVPYYPMLGNLYYAKFRENGVLIRHFVPVPAGLVIGNFTVPSNGMFDIVNQQFHPNLGTGTFNIGRDN